MGNIPQEDGKFHDQLPMLIVSLHPSAKTPKERGACDPEEVVKIRAQGKTFEEIAARLGVSIGTVRKHYYAETGEEALRRNRPSCDPRDVVRLRSEGKTFDQIAAALGVSRATASRRFYDGKVTGEIKTRNRAACSPKEVVRLLLEHRGYAEIARRLNVSKATVKKVIDGIRLLGADAEIGASWGNREVGKKINEILELRKEGKTFAQIACEVVASGTDVRNVFRAFTSLVENTPMKVPLRDQAAEKSEDIISLRRGGTSFNEIGRRLKLDANVVRDFYYSATGEKPRRLKKLDCAEIVRLRAEDMSYTTIASIMGTSDTRIQRALHSLPDLDPALEAPIRHRSVCDPSEIVKLKKEGKTFKQIASVLNISETVAYSYFHRETGLPPKPNPKVNCDPSDVVRLRSEGISFGKIAQLLQVSESTARGLFKIASAHEPR